MPYIASNDGLTFQWRDPGEDYQLQAGDIDMGLEAPTEEQLTNVFPNYRASKTLQEAAPIDAVEKIKSFIALNPDVAALVK